MLLWYMISIVKQCTKFYFLYFMKRRTVSVQSKPLNGITLGQRQTDFNSRLIIISKWASVYKRYESVIWELSIWINLIPLTKGWPTFFTIGPLYVVQISIMIFFSFWLIFLRVNLFEKIEYILDCSYTFN